jgi:hypothetical protein
MLGVAGGGGPPAGVNPVLSPEDISMDSIGVKSRDGVGGGYIAKGFSRKEIVAVISTHQPQDTYSTSTTSLQSAVHIRVSIVVAVLACHCCAAI